nr:hypothetical protein [Lachnospiraceae bacterium]
MKRRVIIVIILLLFLLSACGNSMNKTEQEHSSEPEKTMATEQEGGLPTAETESAFPEDPQAYLDELRGRYPDAICAVTINPSRKGDIYVIDLDLDRPETASAAAEIRRAFGDRALLVWTSSLGLTTGTPEDLKRMHRDYIFSYQLDGMGELLKLGDIEAARTACVPPAEDEVEEEIRRYMEVHPGIIKIDKTTVEPGDLMKISYKIYSDSTVYDEVREVPVRCGTVNFDETIEGSVEGRTAGETYTIPYAPDKRFYVEGGTDPSTVCEIRILYLYEPSGDGLTDDYVRDNTEYASVEAWKGALREQIRQGNRQEAWETARQKLMKDCEFRTDPEKLIERVSAFAFEMKIRAEQLGLSEKEYLRALTGQDTENLIHWAYDRCEEEVHEILLIRAIAEYADLDVTEAEMRNRCREDGMDFTSLTETEQNKLKYLMLYDKAVRFMTEERP